MDRQLELFPDLAPEHAAALVEDESYVPATEEAWGELWTATKQMAKARHRVDRDTTTLHRNWGEDFTGLWLPSDTHIGSEWSDMDQMEKDFGLVGQFRQAYPSALKIAFLGDPIDGYFAGGRHPEGMHEETETRLDRQEGLFLWVAEKAGLNWEVLLLGCHEAWTLKRGGRDPLWPMCRHLGAAHGGFGVALTAEVGTQTYRLLLRHKARREGGLNSTNPHRNLDDEMAFDSAGNRPDVIALAHLHFNDLQVKNKAGRKVVFTRSGSYKGGDNFVREGGYQNHKGADHGAPLLIFHPEKKDILPFDGHHWTMGLDVLGRLVANKSEV